MMHYFGITRVDGSKTTLQHSSPLKGSERPGHKYIDRKPRPGGKYYYIYKDDNKDIGSKVKKVTEKLDEDEANDRYRNGDYGKYDKYKLRDIDEAIDDVKLAEKALGEAKESGDPNAIKEAENNLKEAKNYLLKKYAYNGDVLTDKNTALTVEKLFEAIDRGDHIASKAYNYADGINEVKSGMNKYNRDKELQKRLSTSKATSSYRVR